MKGICWEDLAEMIGTPYSWRSTLGQESPSGEHRPAWTRKWPMEVPQGRIHSWPHKKNPSARTEKMYRGGIPMVQIDFKSIVYTLSKLQWPRCNWEFQCRSTGHSVKFHWFPVEFHWISSGFPLNFPVAPGSLVISDLSPVIAKSVGF